MYVIGDIGNTETKICVYSTQKKNIKKINLKSNLLSNSYLKKKLFFILKKKNDIKKVIFSSVVQKKFKLIKAFLLKNLKVISFYIHLDLIHIGQKYFLQNLKILPSYQ